MGRVGDELLPGIVELREAQPHAVEGAGELTELVEAVVDNGRVEPSRRDAVGGALQALDPARECPCAAVTDAERHQQPNQAGDQESALDDVDRRVLRGERRDEQDCGAGRANRNGDLAVRLPVAENGVVLDLVRGLRAQRNPVVRKIRGFLDAERVVLEYEEVVGRVRQHGDARVRARRRRIDELSGDVRVLKVGLQARRVAFELLQPGVNQSVL